MHRERLGLCALSVVVTALTALSMPSASASGPLTWTGKVTRVTDGDTAYIDIDGDDKGPVLVRNASIQAMETGECHAKEATERHRQLVEGKTVRLSATQESSSNAGRPVRYVDVLNPDGTYTDVQLELLKAGHVLWLNNLAGEDGRSATYQQAAQRAATEKRNLWNPIWCGRGPAQSVPLEFWINYDADGVDSTNLNGEYVRIKNTGSSDVSLGGWYVRDASHLTPYYFPSGTVLRAGSYLTLHVGKGTRTAADHYWGLTTPQFGNVSATSTVGDSAYLYDLRGDVRAYASYLCRVDCADPVAGKVRISGVKANVDGDDAVNFRDEYIALRASERVDLSHRVLEVNGNVRELAAGSVIQAGETLYVRPGTGTSSRLLQWWGRNVALLPNGGGTVVLRNTEGTVLDSVTW